jgi:hypothetical protein
LAQAHHQVLLGGTQLFIGQFQLQIGLRDFGVVSGAE